MPDDSAPGRLLHILSLNFQYGGIDDGRKDRWHALTRFLNEREPDVLLCQEMQAATPSGVERHLHDTASALGMTPVALGPAAPGAASGSEHHTAILVRPGRGLEVIETGPTAAYRAWDHVPWAEALLAVEGLRSPVRFYSVHLSPSALPRQVDQASKLATRVAMRAERGEHAMAAGDYNSLAPGDGYTQEQLAAMPARIRPARIRLLPDDVLEPILDVHYVLASVGLHDIAAALQPGRREPRDLTPTGTAGGRVDRGYADGVLMPAVTRAWQAGTGAGDHEALGWDVSIPAAAAQEPEPGAAKARSGARPSPETAPGHDQ